MQRKIEIVKSILEKIIRDFGEDGFLQSSLSKIKSLKDSDELRDVLYGIISGYMIDEITFQPTEKYNFVDMGSYYYRSDSDFIDFPKEFYKKYDINEFHLDRNRSIFFSNKKTFKNFFKRTPEEIIGNTYLLVDSFSDRKIPSSRQDFLIDYFFKFPEKFLEFFEQKYSGFKNFEYIYNLRRSLGYYNHLNFCLDYSDENIKINNEKIKKITLDKEFILTSSGTSANQLCMEYFGKEQAFFHKYWYWENTDGVDLNYFKDIDYNNFSYFYLSLEPTNYFDIEEPEFFEDIESEITKLIDHARLSGREITIVLDVTTNPYFNVNNIPENIKLYRTTSLTKFQQGLNVNFLGLIFGDDISLLQDPSRDLGFDLDSLSRRFLYLPQFEIYKNYIDHINDFTCNMELDLDGWFIKGIGLSAILLPYKDTISSHIKKFCNNKDISDKDLSWKLRDKLQYSIEQLALEDLYVGDSFLFMDSRINMQGRRIQTLEYGSLDKKYKYRLPRISPGFEVSINNKDGYIDLFKKMITHYENTYNLL